MPPLLTRREAGIDASTSAHISIRDRLDGCGLYVGKQLDGKSWRAFLFPNRFEPPIEGEIADDPVSAVMRMARKLQALPFE